MTTKLPTDVNARPIPVLGLLTGGSHKVSFTGTAARNSTPFNSATRIITIFATQSCFVRQGGAGVTAVGTDHLIPAGIPVDLAIDGQASDPKTHISAVQLSTGGDLYISERE